jgi:hypothetical protein
MFTVIHTNKTFDLNVENNMNVGELYDMVRAKVNNPFDLIYKINGTDGKYINKNHKIDLLYNDQFYIRFLKHDECDICYHTKLIHTLSCNHEICSDCYSQVTLCPFCRRNFDCGS